MPKFVMPVHRAEVIFDVMKGSLIRNNSITVVSDIITFKEH